MLHREPFANVAVTTSWRAGGWVSQDRSAADAEDGAMAWLGGLSVALWACATLMALYFN